MSELKGAFPAPTSKILLVLFASGMSSCNTSWTSSNVNNQSKGTDCVFSYLKIVLKRFKM